MKDEFLQNQHQYVVEAEPPTLTKTPYNHVINLELKQLQWLTDANVHSS